MLSPTENRLLTPRGHAALDLAKQGFRIFPLKPNAKTPAIECWPERATTDSATSIRGWSSKDYNIGIATGSPPRIGVANGTRGTNRVLIVVDYDMKPGQLGEKALKEHTLLGYADTLTVKTPNGIHKYYWADAELRIPNSVSRIAINVDVRGERGYVVGPGSIIDGVEYKIISDEKEPGNFPDELAKLAVSISTGPQGPALEHGKAPLGALDHPSAIAAAKRYLINDAPEAIEGSGGDATTYRVAATIKDMGLSEDEAFELMAAHWNEEKAHRPWSPEELRIKVRNAYRYGQNAPGSSDPFVEFDVGNSGDKDPTPPQRGLYRLSYRQRIEMAGKSHGNPLIKGLLKRNTVNVLYGPSNSGKTFVAMDMAFAVATGQDWNGRKTSRGLVIYVAAEGGSGINERTKALDMVRKPATDPAFDAIPCPIDLLRGSGPESHTGKLIALIRDAEREYGERCALVVIDTLSRALAGGEENSSVDMGTFIKHIDQIKFATGAAVLIIHHSGKDIARGARGWSGVLAAIDTEMELYENTFSNTKQRDLPKIDDLAFQLETVRVGIDEDGDGIDSCVLLWGPNAEFEVELTPAEDRLFEALTKSPLTKFSLGELRVYLAEQTGDPALVAIATGDESVLRQWLSALETKRPGRVCKPTRGRWALLPGPGASSATSTTPEKDQ